MGGKEHKWEKEGLTWIKSIDCCVVGSPAKVQTISDQKQ